MKAMILAAGLGSRLGQITADKPKALVEVAGKPMLEWIIARLKLAGVTSLILNLHYKGDAIRAFIKEKADFGLDVSFSEEPIILGTGGGLKQVEAFFKHEAAFLVHNCDVYSEIDLIQLVKKHSESKAVATLATLERTESSYLLFDEKENLSGWETHDKKNQRRVRQVQERRRCFTGIQVLSPEIFSFMPGAGINFPIIDAYLAAAAANKIVKSYAADSSFWIDMGTPERLITLEQRLKADQ
jgi:MurNAc alpha-1-phosphate uridylyltransferase